MNPPKIKMKIYYKECSRPDELLVLSYNFDTPGFLCIHETTDLVHYISVDSLKGVKTKRVKETTV